MAWSLLQRLWFDLWYLSRPPWDTGLSPPELFPYIKTHRPGRAVDLGCGTGTNVLTLARRGWQVEGLDFSPRAIHLARRRLQRECAEAVFRVADISGKLELRGPFDLALDIGCFPAVQDRARHLGNLANLLGVGGHWLMYAFLRQGGTRSSPRISEVDLDLVASKDLRLVGRTDGLDRVTRPSAWFLFEKAALTG